MVRAAQKGEMENPSPEVAKVAASAKRSDVKKFASTKHKGLPMKKEEVIKEEDYDRMKDRRMERGGVGGNQRPNFASGPKKSGKKYDGMGALDFVKKSIRAKHGHGAIIDTKKEGYAPGDVDQKLGAVTAIPDDERKAARERILAKAKAKREARLKKESVIVERGDFWHPDPDKDKKLGGPGANQRAREDRGSSSSTPKKEDPKKLRKGESYMDYSKRQSASKKPRYSPELQKRIDAAKAKKKEGIVGKVMRKVGLKKEEVEGKSFKQFLDEGNRTGRMMQKSKTQVTGHISADRGSDEKKNRAGRKNLEKDLKKHGIGHKKGVGEYKYDSGETGREVSYQTSKPDKMSKRRFGKVMRRLGRKHGQESVITKDKDKSAKLHYTEKGSKAKSDSIGKTKAGKHPAGYGETSGTKVRGGKLPKKTNKGSYHYG
tara:strand:- start:2514 stop:3806 length:1293 start_codon:yes stop_codon:yes gene_type:complete